VSLTIWAQRRRDLLLHVRQTEPLILPPRTFSLSMSHLHPYVGFSAVSALGAVDTLAQTVKSYPIGVSFFPRPLLNSYLSSFSLSPQFTLLFLPEPYTSEIYLGDLRSL